MKTLDEAIADALRVNLKDADADLVRRQSIIGFGQDTGNSHQAMEYIDALINAYFQEPSVDAFEVLMSFGMSCFASGVRVGVEMERT